MKPRDIFGLAVRLLGLFFFYLGLRATAPLLDLEAIESAGKSDIVNVLLPVIFNLLVGWWLLGGGWLMQRAYPETPKILEHSRSQAERGAATADSTQALKPPDMNSAETKLASLLAKPKDGRAV